jgi:uncharacterized protein
LTTSSSRDTCAPFDRLSHHLLALCRDIAAAMPLPTVDHIYLPPPQSATEKSRKFGLVVLADSSTGFFFTLLGDDAERGRALLAHHPRDVLELAAWFDAPDSARRAIGLGAIGAISQALFHKCGFVPPDAINPIADLEPSEEDHIGMVGYFPGLVAHLRERHIPLTVLELDPALVRRGERFEVTLDPSRLAHCNKILCTASTLINDTVDDILTYTGGAHYVALIGPSANCVPEPLFERGVSLVGGSAVIDFNRLQQCCESGEDWGSCVRKYCLSRDNYPGTRTLIERMGSA